MPVKVTMQDLMSISKNIKDPGLRKKVDGILKDPEMSRKDLARKYRPADLKEVPASLQFHHTYDKGLLEHTYAVARLCISVGETLNEVYKMELDMDSLVAAALVHDIGKLWGMKKEKEKPGWEATDLMLDHTMAGTSELYARGFPEKVLHIVASHFGENGPTPPQTMEAVIFHTIDNLDAVVGTNRQENLLNLLLKQQ